MTKENRLIKKGLNALGTIDTKQLMEMFRSFDKNFATISDNQVFMQENQVEFEKYLKRILVNQNLLLTRLKKIETKLK